MKKTLTMSLVVLATVTGTSLAFSQNATQPPNSPSLQARVQKNLEQAGFSDVQVMARSFLVRAKDQDGNPVMMVINPDSVTAVTELPTTQSASADLSDRVALTSAQRQELWQNLSRSGSETPPPGFTAKVGAAVPSNLNLKTLPGSVSTQIPAIKADEYAMVQNQVLIVDPASKKILAIVTP